MVLMATIFRGFFSPNCDVFLSLVLQLYFEPFTLNVPEAVSKFFVKYHVINVFYHGTLMVKQLIPIIHWHIVLVTKMNVNGNVFGLLLGSCVLMVFVN